jgi:hypothetical protein
MSSDLHSAQPGIRFNDCLFSEPLSIAGWVPPKYAGLLAVLVQDPNWAPKAFQPVYFGEFGNNAPLSAVLRDYPRIMGAAKGLALYVSVLPMPFSTTSQRCELRNQLAWAYNPECQPEGIGQPQGELTAKLNEQIAQMISARLEPQALESRRRQFGFMPQTEPAAS